MNYNETFREKEDNDECVWIMLNEYGCMMNMLMNDDDEQNE